MLFKATVYDIWVFRRTPSGIEFLVLHASVEKAQRYFNGGRFWQVPSGVFRDEETVLQAMDRELAPYGIAADAIWAAEHTYTIYNRRFHEMQLISVFAVETGNATVTLNPVEHAEYAWLPYEDAMSRVHFRGLKDGLRSTHEYITSPAEPARELQLR